MPGRFGQNLKAYRLKLCLYHPNLKFTFLWYNICGGDRKIMDKALAEAARELAADNLFELVQKSYVEANHDYLQKQITIASEYLSKEQKEQLRGKGFVI